MNKLLSQQNQIIVLKGYVFMEGKMLWDKFTKEGKVTDYLEYRKHINGAEAEVKMELEKVDQNQCFGISNKGTERR